MEWFESDPKFYYNPLDPVGSMWEGRYSILREKSQVRNVVIRLYAYDKKPGEYKLLGLYDQMVVLSTSFHSMSLHEAKTTAILRMAEFFEELTSELYKLSREYRACSES